MQRMAIKQLSILTKRCIFHGPPPFARHPDSPEPVVGKMMVILSPFFVTAGILIYADSGCNFREQVVDSVLKCTLNKEEYERVNNSLQPVMKTSSVTQTVSEIPKTQGPKMQDLNFLEMERDLEEHAIIAFKEYQNALNLSKSFNEVAQSVTNNALEKLEPSLLTNLQYMIHIRDKTISKANKTALDVQNRISKYVELSNTTSGANDIEVKRLREKMNVITKLLEHAKSELIHEGGSPKKSKKCSQSVDKPRNILEDEIKYILPNIDFDEKRKTLSQEDFDSFIARAYSHALGIKKEIQNMESNDQSTADILKNGPSDDILKLELHEKFLNHYNKNKIHQIREESDRRLQEQMKKYNKKNSADEFEYWTKYKWMSN